MTEAMISAYWATLETIARSGILTDILALILGFGLIITILGWGARR